MANYILINGLLGSHFKVFLRSAVNKAGNCSSYNVNDKSQIRSHIYIYSVSQLHGICMKKSKMLIVSFLNGGVIGDLSFLLYICVYLPYFQIAFIPFKLRKRQQNLLLLSLTPHAWLVSPCHRAACRGGGSPPHISAAPLVRCAPRWMNCHSQASPHRAQLPGLHPPQPGAQSQVHSPLTKGQDKVRDGEEEAVPTLTP